LDSTSRIWLFRKEVKPDRNRGSARGEGDNPISSKGGKDTQERKVGLNTQELTIWEYETGEGVGKENKDWKQGGEKVFSGDLHERKRVKTCEQSASLHGSKKRAGCWRASTLVCLKGWVGGVDKDRKLQEEGGEGGGPISLTTK